MRLPRKRRPAPEELQAQKIAEMRVVLLRAGMPTAHLSDDEVAAAVTRLSKEISRIGLAMGVAAENALAGFERWSASLRASSR